MQIIIVQHGMEMIRKYEAFAGPVILVTMAALAVWIFIRGPAARSPGRPTDPLTGGAMWRQIFAGGALWVAIYGTFVLNFCDFTRLRRPANPSSGATSGASRSTCCSSASSWWSWPAAQFKIDGTVIESPADIVQTIPNTVLLVAGLAWRCWC